MHHLLQIADLVLAEALALATFGYLIGWRGRTMWQMRWMLGLLSFIFWLFGAGANHSLVLVLAPFAAVWFGLDFTKIFWNPQLRAWLGGFKNPQTNKPVPTHLHLTGRNHHALTQGRSSGGSTARLNGRRPAGELARQRRHSSR